MPNRSQRHLREFYGEDSAGDDFYPGPGPGGTTVAPTIVGPIPTQIAAAGYSIGARNLGQYFDDGGEEKTDYTFAPDPLPDFVDIGTASALLTGFMDIDSSVGSPVAITLTLTTAKGVIANAPFDLQIMELPGTAAVTLMYGDITTPSELELRGVFQGGEVVSVQVANDVDPISNYSFTVPGGGPFTSTQVRDQIVADIGGTPIPNVTAAANAGDVNKVDFSPSGTALKANLFNATVSPSVFIDVASGTVAAPAVYHIGGEFAGGEVITLTTDTDVGTPDSVSFMVASAATPQQVANNMAAALNTQPDVSYRAVGSHVVVTPIGTATTVDLSNLTVA